MEKTERQIVSLQGAGSGEGMKGVTIEAAILGAQSNRELAAATLSAAENMMFAVKHATTILDIDAQKLEGTLGALDRRIKEFSDKADNGTNRLATWTLILALATGGLVAVTGALVYVELQSEPQIIVTPALPQEIPGRGGPPATP
jgi:hypothetical protein